MAAKQTDDPVLNRFRTALDQAYGVRIERVVLFGGRARNEAHADADYEVAVFLHDLSDRWRELDRLADISSLILEDTGRWVHAMAYPAGTYQDPIPRMHEVREGIDL
jgi:predicted nucleotidyltransferase